MQSRYAICRLQEIERHLGARQEGPELLEREEHFAVKSARVVRWLDINEPGLPAVEPGGEVSAGVDMGVVEPEPTRTWRKGNAPHAMRGNKWRSLFCSAVHIS